MKSKAQIMMFVMSGIGTNVMAEAPIAPVAPTAPTAPAALNVPIEKVHYSAGKDVDFEGLLIQGQLKRPEISVVTGNVKQGADGLLRLRENFLDRITSDAGEESAE